MISFQVLLAVLLDMLLGESKRYHPLVGFGRLALSLETALLDDISQQVPAKSAGSLRLLGVLSWGMLVIVPVLLLWYLRQSFSWTAMVFVDVVVLYFSIGARSLREHAIAVVTPLRSGDIKQARLAVARIVSRDCQALEAEAVSCATVESVLENGSDAVLAPIFWFAVAGSPGVLLHRLSNTLDAMWGYRNQRYEQYGWAAARIDDVLNYVPARLCAISYALSGYCLQALRCWRRQASAYASPNAGPVMAAGAGALGVALGCDASYGGELKMRAPLGVGQRPEPEEIVRALGLLTRSIALWLAALFIIEYFIV